MPTFSDIFIIRLLYSFVGFPLLGDRLILKHNFSNGKCGSEKSILKEEYKEEKCLAHRGIKFQLSEPYMYCQILFLVMVMC